MRTMKLFVLIVVLIVSAFSALSAGATAPDPVFVVSNPQNVAAAGENFAMSVDQDLPDAAQLSVNGNPFPTGVLRAGTYLIYTHNMVIGNPPNTIAMGATAAIFVPGGKLTLTYNGAVVAEVAIAPAPAPAPTKGCEGNDPVWGKVEAKINQSVTTVVGTKFCIGDNVLADQPVDLNSFAGPVDPKLVWSGYVAPVTATLATGWTGGTTTSTSTAGWTGAVTATSAPAVVATSASCPTGMVDFYGRTVHLRDFASGLEAGTTAADQVYFNGASAQVNISTTLEPDIITICEIGNRGSNLGVALSVIPQ